MSKAGDDSIFVERGNFEQIPDALWMGGATSPRGVVLYLALSKRGSREDRGIPKRSTLAKDMGVTSVRTVDAAIDELVEKGWLLITPRLRADADQGQTSNHYRLLWTPITSKEDERLIQHQRETAEFDAIMAQKQAKNGNEGSRSVRRACWQPPVQDSAPPSSATPVQDSAPSPRAENCAPPAQKTNTGPAQKSAPQESYLLGTTPSENQTNLLADADASADAQPPTLTLISEVAPSGPQPKFEDFYAIYPRHSKPQAARTAWDKAIKRGVSPAEIMAGVHRYAQDPNRPGGKNRPNDKQYVPYPASWLNGGCWTDEPAAPVAAGRGRAYSDAETWGTEEERIAQAEQKRKAWDDMTEAERQAEIARMFDEDGPSAAAHGG